MIIRCPTKRSADQGPHIVNRFLDNVGRAVNSRLGSSHIHTLPTLDVKSRPKLFDSHAKNELPKRKLF